jgi:branched-chain amino acid transport system permease protein
MAAEAKATTSPQAGQRSLAEVLRVVLGPVGQMLLFVIGSAIALSLLVTLLALAQIGARPDLLVRTWTILPQVLIDGLVRGFLFASIALGYTMVYGVLEFINFAHGRSSWWGAWLARLWAWPSPRPDSSGPCLVCCSCC